MFPNAGNGGYDVQHYDLTLDYTPSSNQLTATAVISARAMQDLSSFNLDLRGFAISRLLVDGRAASFTRDGGQELTVTPRPGILAGTTQQLMRQRAQLEAASHTRLGSAGKTAISPNARAVGWLKSTRRRRIIRGLVNCAVAGGGG